jgi:hypothetical protein
VFFHSPTTTPDPSKPPLFGHILWPPKKDINNPVVEVPMHKLSTCPDEHGRFFFAEVPIEPPLQLLRVHVNGVQIDISPVSRPQHNRPLLINLTDKTI